jgi:hypothetical protein
MVIIYLKDLSHYLLRQTEKNHERDLAAITFPARCFLLLKNRKVSATEAITLGSIRKLRISTQVIWSRKA